MPLAGGALVPVLLHLGHVFHLFHLSSARILPEESVVETGLSSLLRRLDQVADCSHVLVDGPLEQLLRDQLENSKKDLIPLCHFISTHTADFNASLLANSSLESLHPFKSKAKSQQPQFGLQLECSLGHSPQWTPTLVFPARDSPLAVANRFLVVRLDPFDIDLCSRVSCNKKCSWTVHGGIRVFARVCCSDDDTQFCRSDSEQGRNMLLVANAIAACACLLAIPFVFRERRKQSEARGWALMELFLVGAAILYSILLLDWLAPPKASCCIAVWLRQIGFSTFYGAIVLKIYRNLQEYRVRKAQHVYVREEDLLKYLGCMLLLTATGLTAWTVGSWSADGELWASAWPQCAMQSWSLIWHCYELLFLFYGMRLCYKARNSSWLERWQFTVAVCLEAVITLMANLIRYSIRFSGQSDILLVVTFVQLHLTVSVNIVIIMAPKFWLGVSGDTNRRTLTMGGSSGRAHPSLAKLRDNILNGTIDFAEVPIIDMNPEDIRAELKRVYTQLRMYKLKSLYQDNPHISKRKGGGKKWSDKTGKNRRISVPATCSPSTKNRRIEEDEKSDLTVESAPHNVYLSTYKLQLEPDQSVRV